MTRRVVVPGLDLEAPLVKLPPEAARYVATVLRLRRGDEVLVLDGSGMQARGRIASISPRAVKLSVAERSEVAMPVAPALHLIQALPKGGGKLDEIVRRATELGVASIRPALSRRSVARPDDRRSRQRLERWRRIAREAARQCGRGQVPSIEPLGPLDEVLVAAPAETRRLILWENEEGRGLLDGLGERASAQGVTLAVGPEGGFEVEEVTAARDRGFEPVSLGPLVLRVETAAIAACALAQGSLGALDPPSKG